MTPSAYPSPSNHAGKPGCDASTSVSLLKAVCKFQQTSILPHAALSVSNGIIATAAGQSAAVSTLPRAKDTPTLFSLAQKGI